MNKALVDRVATILRRHLWTDGENVCSTLAAARAVIRAIGKDKSKDTRRLDWLLEDGGLTGTGYKDRRVIDAVMRAEKK